MINQLKQRYLEAILNTNRESAFRVIDDTLNSGHSAETVMFEILVPVMEDLAETVKLGREATLAQLYLASQISSEATDLLIPKFSEKAKIQGRIVIGTSYEDFHGLGKKIVGGCLKAHMIEVIDLGLNVSAEKFIDEAINVGAAVIGISSMMVHTARGPNGPSKVRALLKDKDLENKLKLVVGGAPYRFHPDLYEEVGADAWAEDGITAAKVISNLIKEVPRK